MRVAIRPELFAMMTLPGFLRTQPDGVLVSIKLQPRSSADQIGEAVGDELRIRVTAPPVDAAANEALIRLIAKAWDCPRSRIELVRGHKSRHKIIKLHGVSLEELLSRL